jgi:hypothetical protein
MFRARLTAADALSTNPILEPFHKMRKENETVYPKNQKPSIPKSFCQPFDLFY